MMKLAVLVVLISVLALPASASMLDGQTVQTSYLYPNTSTLFGSPINAVVGAGTELLGFVGFVNVDFSDTKILITATRNAGINSVAFDGLLFFDLNGTIPSIGSVTLNAATNYAGFTSAGLSFDANSIFVNLVGLPGLAGQQILIDVAPVTDGSSVPEPGSFALLGGALVLLGRRIARRA